MRTLAHDSGRTCLELPRNQRASVRSAPALSCAYRIEGRQHPNQLVRRRDVVSEVDALCADVLGEIVSRAPGRVVPGSINGTARLGVLQFVRLRREQEVRWCHSVLEAWLG